MRWDCKYKINLDRIFQWVHSILEVNQEILDKLILKLDQIVDKKNNGLINQ